MSWAAHWFRWYHGMVTDPKWSTVVDRCHAKSRQVTPSHATTCRIRKSDVISVAAVLFELASQATPRGVATGWCAEDVATLLGLEEAEVDLIFEAMQGKFLEGLRLLKWEDRQPKRERDDVTAAERKARQREKSHTKSRQVTPQHAKSHHVTHRGEERRREEKEQTPQYSVDTHTQETSRASAREGDAFGGHDPQQVPDEGRAFERLDEVSQTRIRLISHRCAGAPLAWKSVDVTLLAEFLDHAAQKKGVVISAGWMGQIALQIQAIYRDGGNVNEQISATIARGNCVQLLMPNARDGPSPRAGGARVTDNFDGVDYGQ